MRRTEQLRLLPVLWQGASKSLLAIVASSSADARLWPVGGGLQIRRSQARILPG
jgi:hypothetical protein